MTKSMYFHWNFNDSELTSLARPGRARVKSVNGKTQIGYGSNKPLGYYDTPVGRVTFRKVYGRNPRVEVDANA